MRDLDQLVRALAGEDRKTMINALIAADAAAYRSAHSGSREKRLEARSRCERLGRLIYFLRYRSQPHSATVADQELYELIAANLKRKGNG